MIRRRRFPVTAAVALLLVVQGCTSGRATTSLPSPCEDEQFLALRKRPVQELTEEEYRYLTEMELACSDWNKKQPIEGRIDPNSVNRRSRFWPYYLGGVVVGILVTIYLFVKAPH